MKKVLYASKELSRGVFWDIDGELLAFPYIDESDTIGVSKSGNTYNHKKLWNELKPKGSKVSFDYYPRGRVDISNKGKPIVYMNPNVSDDLLPDIRREFGILEDPDIRYDYSQHYKCHLDDGYVPQK